MNLRGDGESNGFYSYDHPLTSSLSKAKIKNRSMSGLLQRFQISRYLGSLVGIWFELKTE